METPPYSLQLKPQSSFPAFFSRPASHGLVCIDEQHAVITFQAKAGEHQNSLLQLTGIEVEASEGRDFQTFRNETVKLLSGIQSRAEERIYQGQQLQEPTLSRNSSATATFVSQTFQQQPAPAAREYILTILELTLLQPSQSSKNIIGNQSSLSLPSSQLTTSSSSSRTTALAYNRSFSRQLL